MLKKIIILYSIIVTSAIVGFFGGKITTENRLVAEHRQQLELSRQRAAALTYTITRAREEVGAIGKSLSRQRTSVAELRSLIAEVRTRYEKMEELLSCAWRDDSDAWNIDICVGTSNGEQVE